MSIFTGVFDRSAAEMTSERQRVKLALAERRLNEKLRNDLLAKERRIQNEGDAAVAEHRNRCEPIQAELAKIREQQAADILAGKSENAKLEARRVQLVGEIESANEALEAVIAKCKQKRQALAGELREITKRVTEAATLDAELMRTAPIELQIEHFALGQVAILNRRTMDGVERQVQALRDSVESDRFGGVENVRLKQQLARWEEVLSILGEQYARVNERAQEVHRQMMS